MRTPTENLRARIEWILTAHHVVSGTMDEIMRAIDFERLVATPQPSGTDEEKAREIVDNIRLRVDFTTEKQEIGLYEDEIAKEIAAALATARAEGVSLCREITDWGDATFPNSTEATVLAHLACFPDPRDAELVELRAQVAALTKELVETTRDRATSKRNYVDEANRLHADLVAAEARCARLEEALRPFAEHAWKLDVTPGVFPDDYSVPIRLPAGDFRRAAALLSETTRLGGDGVPAAAEGAEGPVTSPPAESAQEEARLPLAREKGESVGTPPAPAESSCRCPCVQCSAGDHVACCQEFSGDDSVLRDGKPWSPAVRPIPGESESGIYILPCPDCRRSHEVGTPCLVKP